MKQSSRNCGAKSLDKVPIWCLSENEKSEGNLALFNEVFQAAPKDGKCRRNPL